jgi:hypothetical protein
MIIKKHFYCDLEVRLVGNLVSKDEFFKFISSDCIIRKKIKREELIIFCMSSHDFPIVTGKLLKRSGVMVRTKKQKEIANAVNIVYTLLTTFPNALLLVSHIAKKKLDRHSVTEQYQERIFCYHAKQKRTITNCLEKQRTLRNYKKITKIK